MGWYVEKYVPGWQGSVQPGHPFLFPPRVVALLSVGIAAPFVSPGFGCMFSCVDCIPFCLLLYISSFSSFVLNQVPITSFVHTPRVGSETGSDGGGGEAVPLVSIVGG